MVFLRLQICHLRWPLAARHQDFTRNLSNTSVSKGHTRQTPKETINSGSAESLVATPPIDTIADEEEDSDDEE
jgi:hypothetical protein